MKIFNFLCLFVLLLWNYPLSAQWIPTNGPYGGNAQNIVTIGNNLIVKCGQNAYRSSDNGSTWQRTEDDLNFVNASSLVRNNNIVFASIYGKGVFKSSDDGISWQQINTGLTKLGIRALAVKDDTLFAACDSGLFRSINSGKSWINLDTGLQFSSIYFGAVAICGTSVLVSAGSLYRSTDNGAHWSTDTSNATYVVLNFLIVGDTVFCSTLVDGIFRSPVNSDNWEKASIGLPVISRINTLKKSGNFLYSVVANRGIYRSDDNGRNWIPINLGLPDTIVRSIETREDTIFATTDHGIFRSFNNGDSWTLQNTGIMERQINVITVFANRLYAGTDGILYSDDGGTTWIDPGITQENIVAVATSNDTMYAASWNKLFITIDKGVTWVVANLNQIQYINCLILKGGQLLAGCSGFNGLQRSVNGGLTWNMELNGIDSTVYCFLSKGDTLYAGTHRGVFFTTTNGDIWLKANTGLIYDITALASRNDTLFAGTKFNGIFLSINNGLSWIPFNSGLTSMYIGALASNHYLFIGTHGSGIFITDPPDSWKDYNYGLVPKSIFSFVVYNSNIYAATNGGVWKLSLSNLSEVKSNFYRAGAYSHNYPNPFTQTTSISFYLPSYSIVTVEITDIVGNKVSTVLSKEKLSPGHHEVHWDASGLSNGVYYYYLKSDTLNEMKKILLVR